MHPGDGAGKADHLGAVFLKQLFVLLLQYHGTILPRCQDMVSMVKSQAECRDGSVLETGV